MSTRLFRVVAISVIVLFGVGALVYAHQNQQSESSEKALSTKDAKARAYQPYGKEDHWAFYLNFDKKKPYPNGCYVHKPQGVYGELLRCTIAAPPAAKGHITHIEYQCEGDPTVCGYVHECPSFGQCQDHNYAYEPHELNLVKTRTVDWFGWTNDGNSAILRFDVFMSEEEK